MTRRPMRWAARAAAALLLAAPAIAGAQALSAADSSEIALGRALMARFDAEREITPATPQSRQIEAYLQRIADSLGAHARRRLPWHIRYDPHPGLKSGFALPGGEIVIWGGILSYMSTEDEAAAIIAHEIEHIDDGQVTRRIDSLATTQHRSRSDASQWTWQEFGNSYGPVLENLCDYKGARLAVQAGYSPYGYRTLLESFIALGRVHEPKTPPSKAIVVRIDQINREIREMHWQALTKTRPLVLPGMGN